MTANALRGEASLNIAGKPVLIRPTFEALLAAEEELGSLFGVMERAASGSLRLGEIVALFDHLSASRPSQIGRNEIGAAVASQGLAAVTPILRIVLSQILKGSE